MVCGGRPLLREILGQPAHRPADFEPIIARSASAVRPSEKSLINTNRKFPTRFPTSQRWSSSPSTLNFGLKWPRWRKSPIFDLFSLVAPRAVTSIAKKVQLTLIGSPLRAFRRAQDEHRMLSLSHPQRVAQKRSVQYLNNKLRYLRNGTR